MDKSSCTVCSVPVSFSINDIVSCATVVGPQILVVKEESISSKNDRVAAFITEKYEMVETIIIKESIKASFAFITCITAFLYIYIIYYLHSLQ